MYYLPASFPHRIGTSCRLQCIKGFFCAVKVLVGGFRARLQECGAVLCCGEGSARVSHAVRGPGVAGWRVGVSVPASPCAGWVRQICCSTGSPEREDTSKAKQRALEKLREMPDLSPFSFSPPCKLAAQTGSLHCRRGVLGADISRDRKGVARLGLKCLIPVLYLHQQRTNYA